MSLSPIPPGMYRPEPGEEGRWSQSIYSNALNVSQNSASTEASMEACSVTYAAFTAAMRRTAGQVREYARTRPPHVETEPQRALEGVTSAGRTYELHDDLVSDVITIWVREGDFQAVFPVAVAMLEEDDRGTYEYLDSCFEAVRNRAQPPAERVPVEIRIPFTRDWQQALEWTQNAWGPAAVDEEVAT